MSLTYTKHVQNILLIKTSSLGDIIHNFPAITDLIRQYPEASVDWVIEENYASLPIMHRGVHEVIPVSIRRWRKETKIRETLKQIRNFFSQLRLKKYDAIIDTQGLLKSALIAWAARGTSYGMNLKTSREPVSFFYSRSFEIEKNQHAIQRNRQLMAISLGYRLDDQVCYGIDASRLMATRSHIPKKPYAILLPSSSNHQKSWFTKNWILTGKKLSLMKFRSVFLAGKESEFHAVKQLAREIPDAEVFPISTLDKIALVVAHANLVIGVDTGITHLAAALGRPTIGIYHSTDPAKTGIYGEKDSINYGGKGIIPTPDEIFLGINKLGIEA